MGFKSVISVNQHTCKAGPALVIVLLQYLENKKNTYTEVLFQLLKCSLKEQKLDPPKHLEYYTITFRFYRILDWIFHLLLQNLSLQVKRQF